MIDRDRTPAALAASLIAAETLLARSTVSHRLLATGRPSTPPARR
jgi:hypothetical protein